MSFIFLEENDSQKKPEAAVLNQLINNGPQTVKEISKGLAKKGIELADRSIYRVIDKLEDAHIVTKLKSYIVLDLGWLATSMEALRRAYEMQLEHLSLQQILGSAQKNVWKFTDVRLANLFLLQIMMAVLYQDNTKVMYDWALHPWYFFCSNHAEARFNQTVKMWDGKINRIIGGTGWLDKEPLSHWEINNSLNVFGNAPFETLNSYILIVVGEYVITLKLGKKQTDLMQEIYDDAEKYNKANVQLINTFLNMREKISVEIELNSIRANRYISQFRKRIGEQS